MKKIINIIQTILVVYLLSMLMILPFILWFNDSVIILKNGNLIGGFIMIILPIPLMIAMYLYLGIKELKVDYKRSISVLLNDSESKNEQIANYEILTKIKDDRIDELEKEKAEDKHTKEIKDVMWTMSTSDKNTPLPFSDKPDTTYQQWVCPECNQEMTRNTKSIVFCDNIHCTRKQWRKDKL